MSNGRSWKLAQSGVGETDDTRDRFVQGEQEMAQIDIDMSELKQRVGFLKVDKRR